jgi:hypothetical protein
VAVNRDKVDSWKADVARSVDFTMIGLWLLRLKPSGKLG